MPVDEQYRHVATAWDEKRIWQRLLDIAGNPDYYDLHEAVVAAHAIISESLRSRGILLAADGTAAHAHANSAAVVRFVDHIATTLDWTSVLDTHKRPRPCRATPYTVEECVRLCELCSKYVPHRVDATEAGVEIHTTLAETLPDGYTLDHDGGLGYPNGTSRRAVDAYVRRLGDTLAGVDVLEVLRRHPYDPATARYPPRQR